MAVKFIKRMSPYQVDDIAGFTPEREEELIKANVAEKYEVKDSKKKPEKKAD